MARDVLIRLKKLSANGKAPANAKVRFTPTILRVDAEGYILDDYFDVIMVDGEGTANDLPETDLNWAYKVQIKGHGAGGGLKETYDTWYVHLPEGEGTVNFEDLPRIDPTTLTPVNDPDPKWVEAVTAVFNDSVSTAVEPAMVTAVEDETSEFRARLTAAIDERSGAGGGAPTLAPVYVETRDTGLASNTPANLRTGLSTETMPGGGFTEELAISVTGSKGSRTLTTTETSKVAGLGADPFEAALNAADGSDDFFNTVLSHNGSTQITLRYPLARDFTGTLSAKYDANLGQHLTRAGTRAYVQHAATYSGTVGSRGDIIAGTWDTLPPTLNRTWKLNDAVTAYGRVNSGGVVTDLTNQNAVNLLHAVDKLPIRPSGEASGVQVGTHKLGHGATATIDTGKADAVVDFWVAARLTTTQVGFSIRVVVKGDGATIHDRTYDGWLNRVVVPASGYSRVTVDVTNANTTDTAFTLQLSNLTVRRAGTGPKVGKGKIVLLGDSWFGYYNGLAAKVLAEKTGAKTINRGLGGMTTEWALDWFDEHVLKERPDEVWLHFFTNDLNLVDATYTAPDGTEKPRWKNTNQTMDQARATWAQNILALVERARLAGIRPVVFMPGGTASQTQMQKHASSVAWLDQAPLARDWQATPAELIEPAAYLNKVGKYTGRRAMVGTAEVFATGSSPADQWRNPANDAILGLQRVSLPRSRYFVETGPLAQLDWGTPGSEPDTITIEEVAEGTKVTIDWNVNGAAGHRFSGSLSTTAGREYLSVVKVINATGTRMNDSTSTIGGGTNLFGSTRDGITNGEALLAMRATETTTTTRAVATGQGRNNGNTTTFTVTDIGAVDLTALFADAPNLASLTDREVAEFVLSLP